MKDKIKLDQDAIHNDKATSGSQKERAVDRTVFRQNASTDARASSSLVNAAVERTRIKHEQQGRSIKNSSGLSGSSEQRSRKTDVPDSTRIKPSGIRAGNDTIAHVVSGHKSNRNVSPGYRGNASSVVYDDNNKRVLKDRFTLDKVIGVGGMGVVYRAVDKLKVEARDREPYVAIKVLSEEFRSHPESFIALQRESRKTQRIAHPNVVKVYDFDRDGDTVFMTMEYMEGVPLDQLIKQYSATGLPREEAWAILGGLCSALIYAHAEKIVHSDFKPGNIFVTDGGIPKIFDFGIARAVANVDRMTGKIRDRTVFDAGSLGALTPAYASLEMLMGKEPDIRDDIYALGCIAYEMLTGSHPYNRLPADEALKSRLKPKKINNLKKKQWRAIEKALMFRREDRIDSVEEFYRLIQPQRRSLTYVIPTVFVLIAIGVSTYLIVSHQDKPSGPNAAQVDKIKFTIQYGLYKQKIQQLLASRTFTPSWEDMMWEEVSGLMQLLDNHPDRWLSGIRKQIYGLYLKHYQKAVANKKYTLASDLLSNAARYTDNLAYIKSERMRLEQLIQSGKKLAEITKNRLQKVAVARSNFQKKVKRDDYLFSLALKNVNQQLECQSDLNMRELSIAVGKLKSINEIRFQKLENQFIETLSSCITHVGKVQPERAMEDKRYALRLFPGSKDLESIVIVPRDACNRSIAGLGARGERAVCRDAIKGGGVGPAMVVIPGNGTIRTFAIGKYEITDREINNFCRRTSFCAPLKTDDEFLPAVNIDIHTAQAYIQWLSRVTGKKYRLPTRDEWMYAARSTGNYQDPNRNCVLNSRGIEKGGSLVRANTGSQNGWGLVNYLGNAREWVYSKSHQLEAVGGSYRDSMDQCTINTVVKQSGRPDDMTGFRVVRDVTR